MGMLGKGVGVLAKGIGSATPSFVLEEQPQDDNAQFKVTAHKIAEDWFLSINPGWSYYTQHVLLITSTGNRDILAGDSGINSADDYASFRQKYHASATCYKALASPTVANDFRLGQKYKAESDQKTYVVVCHGLPGNEPPRVLVIGETFFEQTFLFGCDAANGDLGTSAVTLTKSGSTLNKTTVTISGNLVLTSGSSVSSESATYWERMGISCKVIAIFDHITGSLTQIHTGPVYFDQTSEHYTKEVPIAQVTTQPDIVDGGWSAIYYTTASSNAPTGYTFDYTYPNP